ncbi:MAG TPA: PQQ-dependent sugar dehydrogenase [Gaiellaceae bacterium]|nr:PQQ-dependent sugar dehydrogenase [Gaiellaceae bacterium]
MLRTSQVTHLAAPRSAPGRLYVVQQNGLVRLVVGGRLRKAPFLDLRRRVSVGGEQGLLALAFHPQYRRNRLLYVHYSGLPNVTRVVEYRANRAGTAALTRSARPIFSLRQPGAEHKGGELTFGPDGELYLGLGDGECCDDPTNRAQDLGQLFGKLVRFDVGARPARPPEIVGYGLRNPWRLSFDRETGDLYVADVGAGLFEEVDYRPRAELDELVNYGWDVWEARATKEDKPRNPTGRLVFPVHAYPHVNRRGCSGSITGGYVYRGSAVPAARGRYFFGDYCGGEVWSLRMENGAAVDVRREAGRFRGLTTFGEDARGELYAATQGGGVYKLIR